MSAGDANSDGELLLGTSSWSEKTWEGVFYPSGLPPAEYLSHYATRFKTVEADSTYYRVPDRRLVHGWMRKTPPGFVLSAKFTRTIVHGGEAETPNPDRLLKREIVGADTDRFLEAMSELGPKCGPLVLQFPYLNRKAFSSAGTFLERLNAFLGSLPKEHRYAVEVRNKEWLTMDLTAILKQHRVALVLVDLNYMPHPADLIQKIDLVTTDFIYVRLIGDRRLTDSLANGRWDRTLVDQTSRLERWADLIRTFRRRVPTLLVYANNHYAGYAPSTIEKLRELLGIPLSIRQSAAHTERTPI